MVGACRRGAGGFLSNSAILHLLHNRQVFNVLQNPSGAARLYFLLDSRFRTCLFIGNLVLSSNKLAILYAVLGDQKD